VTITTTLSEIVCSLYAGTSYDRSVYQIWNVYVDPLRRYERQQKMQKYGWFGVTQGHRQHNHLIEHIWLSIASILYDFRAIAHFSLKVADFNPLHLHFSPRKGIQFEFRQGLWHQKTRVPGVKVPQFSSRCTPPSQFWYVHGAIVRRYLLRDPMFSRFDTIPECDRYMTTAYTVLA